MEWRCKSMAFEEWGALHDRFEALFKALRGPREMMLLIRRDPEDYDRHIVLISGHKSDAVEALASGDWADCPNPQQHKWQRLVAHQDAPGEYGIELGSDD